MTFYFLTFLLAFHHYRWTVSMFEGFYKQKVYNVIRLVSPALYIASQVVNYGL